MSGFRLCRTLLVLSLVLSSAPFVLAQQTGAVSGKVTSSDGATLPGVTVEARSASLPQARVTTTEANGDYRLPALQPGRYTLTFSLAGLQTATRNVEVLLGQDAPINVTLGLEGVSESITVTADVSLVDPDSTAIKSAIGEQMIDQLPIGQEYRDLVKLIPGVQYSEDTIRGPSAGGSGQDNTYLFDGVNVTLPLFGTLSAEPSTHDIAQISVVKGGAQAMDFNRAAGFTIDTVSKSGTSEFKGELGFEIQTDSMRGDVTGQSVSQFEQSRDWLTANLGGPILADRLFFYGSYYKPTIERTKRTNAYGELPNYDSDRNEYFGKLTYTPTSSILLNGSYRKSDREIINASIGANSNPSTAVNEESTFDVGILEGSWVINSRSLATFKYTDYLNATSSLPNNILSVSPSTAAGTRIDINALDQLGNFFIPALRAPTSPANIAFNEFVAPLIQRYGFVRNGVRTGGGDVGVGSQINDQDFFRKGGQVGYDLTLGNKVTHDLHAGFQWQEDGEDLARVSNGWGAISVTAGTVNFTPPGGTATPVFYQAQFTRSPVGGTNINIHSTYKSQNFEINDTIRWNNWSFNAGVLVSKDTLYGQGLKEDSSALSGYVLAPGNIYKMYEVPWEKTIQPRFGATWSYNGADNVYASYARYVPAALSLPRAASWDRNTLGLTTRVHFDATGQIIGSEQVSSSSGKLFVEDLDPRHTDEYLVGTSQQINNRWTARAYGRYRYSTNFWEDIENDTLVRLAPAEFRGPLYIENLIQQLNQLNKVTNSTNRAYVIAQIDGAFTKYYEVTAETDWSGNKFSARGSYTWSHYYGNFDQDNTSLDSNDSSIFIGSSALSDGGGRQIWDNKYGDLRGDRRQLLKMYGSYQLPWTASVGVWGTYQSGQPWEPWNYEVYRTLPNFGTSTSDQARYAEPAGRYRSDDHYQFDVNYTQRIPIKRFALHFDLDAFNILDNQTGYNFEPSVHRAGFGRPRDFFDPRRYEFALRFEF